MSRKVKTIVASSLTAWPTSMNNIRDRILTLLEMSSCTMSQSIVKSRSYSTKQIAKDLHISGTSLKMEIYNALASALASLADHIVTLEQWKRKASPPSICVVCLMYKRQNSGKIRLLISNGKN